MQRHLKLKALLSVLLFITAGSTTNLQAQTGSPLFRHFTTEDGLPSSEVYFALQDSKGSMWFATDHGVAKFNGYEFHTFTTKDGLSDNTVFKLFEDKKGRIWMLTFSGKIFFFENNKINPYRYNHLLNTSNENIIPMGIYVDRMENVYVTFLSRGELKIDNTGTTTWRFTQNEIIPLKYTVDEFDEGFTLTSASYNDNNRIHPVRIVHTHATVTDTISFPSIATGKFNALRLDKNKMIYSISKSLYEVSNRTVRLLFDLPAEISFLMKDSNRLWVGSSDGVYCFDNADFSSPSHHYLQKKTVSGIFRDYEGGYWFTTLEDGIHYLPGDAVHGIFLKEEFLQQPLSLTIGNNSTIYAGYWGGALAEINKVNVKLVYLPKKKKEDILTVNSLYSDTVHEKIYIGQNRPGFFWRNDFHLFKNKFPHGLKTNFLKHSDGNLYCAGSSFIFKVKGDSLEEVAIVGQRINCLAETEDHQWLLGCTSGAFIYDEKKNELALFHKELDNIRVDDIRWFHHSNCFATKGKGVLFFVNGKMETIDESKGLCSDLVTKLFVNGNDVWCATNKGISHIHFDDVENFRYTITNIHASDGLLSDEVNDIIQMHDTMYVATKSGLSFFNKNTDFTNHTKPFIQIKTLRVNNTDTTVAGNMEFNHTMNNIRIGFDGISYRSRGKISYRYMLTSGADTVSEFTSNRDVEFLSLAPGHYTFSVSAVNSSRVWSEAPATFRFFIQPAWWQTWWFRTLALLTLVALVYVVYKSQLKKMREKFTAERKQASLHLTALRAQMNPHFIFNTMSSIRNYMQKNDTASAEKYLTSFAKHMRNTLDYSEIQEISLEEELKALKVYAELEMQGFEKGFEFLVRCDSGIDIHETMLPSLLLQPFVENAVKHGISRLPCTGRITVEVKKTDQSILIIVEDNGVGRQEAFRWNKEHAHRHTSHGTAITFERIEAFNKAYNRNIRATIIDLAGNNGKPGGTRVEIQI